MMNSPRSPSVDEMSMSVYAHKICSFAVDMRCSRKTRAVTSMENMNKSPAKLPLQDSLSIVVQFLPQILYWTILYMHSRYICARVMVRLCYICNVGIKTYSEFPLTKEGAAFIVLPHIVNLQLLIHLLCIGTIFRRSFQALAWAWIWENHFPLT